MAASRPKKRFVGSNSTASPKRGVVQSKLASQIPEEILTDSLLNQAISQLPSNYSFEIHKTIHHVRKNKARMVALQMPEGLQMFACTISDIIERFTDALTVIMGDVTYGACCIDDYTAVALDCDMLVHYGHSCLVPIDQTTIKTLYVFVEIAIDASHLVDTVRLNLPSDRATFYEQLMDAEASNSDIPAGQQLGKHRYLLIEGPSSASDYPNHGDAQCRQAPQEPTRIALVSTIQFVSALQKLKDDLVQGYEASETSGSLPASQPRLWTGKYEATVPRSKPLSPGEILGCTAPSLKEADAILYLGDGRFHLESIMIANPTVPAFRYDPYSKKLTREYYNHSEMQRVRDQAVKSARESIASLLPSVDQTDPHPATTSSDSVRYPQIWAVILGTLGRQGSFKQLQAITNQLSTSCVPIPYVPILLSEVSPAKLSLFDPHISTFVQTSCPRLSIDWGYAFSRPLLSPYETNVALGQAKGWTDKINERGETKKAIYPMDFYEAGTPWAVSRLKGSF